MTLADLKLPKGSDEALAAAGITTVEELGEVITEGRLGEIDGITQAMVTKITKAYDASTGLDAEPEERVAFPTVYDGVEASAVACQVMVARLDDTHPSKWWREAGLCGQVVPALDITYRPAGSTKFRHVFIYDGDGAGTLKYLTNGGATRFGHREVDTAGVVL